MPCESNSTISQVSHSLECKLSIESVPSSQHSLFLSQRYNIHHPTSFQTTNGNPPFTLFDAIQMPDRFFCTLPPPVDKSNVIVIEIGTYASRFGFAGDESIQVIRQTNLPDLQLSMPSNIVFYQKPTINQSASNSNSPQTVTIVGEPKPWRLESENSLSVDTRMSRCRR